MKGRSASLAIRVANQTYSEIHTGQNGHHKQINKQQVLKRMWRRGNPSALLVGMQTGAATRVGGSDGGKMETTVLEQ